VIDSSGVSCGSSMGLGGGYVSVFGTKSFELLRIY
jgi:hypothetical protein